MNLDQYCSNYTTKRLNRPPWVNAKLIPLKISLQGLQHIIELTLWLSESAAPEIYIPTTSLQSLIGSGSVLFFSQSPLKCIKIETYELAANLYEVSAKYPLQLFSPSVIYGFNYLVYNKLWSLTWKQRLPLESLTLFF